MKRVRPDSPTHMISALTPHLTSLPGDVATLNMPSNCIILLGNDGFYFRRDDVVIFCTYVQLADWVRSKFSTQQFENEVSEVLVGTEYTLVGAWVSNMDAIGLPKTLTIHLNDESGEEPDEYWSNEGVELMKLISPIARKYDVGISFPSSYYGK